MPAARLKMRRYKVKKRGGGWWLLLLIGILLGGGVWLHQAEKPLMQMPPAPTLTPQESAAEERTILLPARGWFALQLGVFEQESTARELAESYKTRGAGGLVAGESPFRVLAAAYETRADAQSVQMQLIDLHGVEAYIHEITRPEVTLRVKGQQAQLLALSDAYDTLDQAALRLSALSQGLDQHVLTQEEVKAALQSEETTFTILKQRLQSLFGAAAHDAVMRLEAILEEIREALHQAAQATGESKLGAQVKYCQLLCIVRMGEYAAYLAG